MYISRVCARAHAGLPQTKDLVIIYFYIVHNMELRHQDVYTVHPAHVLFGPLLLQPNCWGGIGSITLNVLDRCILDISTDILAEIRFILRPWFFFSAFERHGKLCCFVCSSKCHSTFMTFSYIVWYTRDNFELDTENRTNSSMVGICPMNVLNKWWPDVHVCDVIFVRGGMINIIRWLSAQSKNQQMNIYSEWVGKVAATSNENKSFSSAIACQKSS